MRIANLAVLVVLLGAAKTSHADDWRQFRGPGGMSVAESVAVPIEWDVQTGANVAWEADLPGNGVSSPIVVGGRVVVTAASGPDNDRLHVLAFDSATGRPLWRRRFWATGRTLCYRTSSVAAPTPASDGEYVYAFYSSNDLVCLDLDGNLRWTRGLTLDHPGLGNDIGMAASPIVVGDSVVVQCESQTASFVGAYHRGNGKTRWENPRPKDSNWTSPVAIPGGEADRSAGAVLLQGREGLAVHNGATGELLWQSSLRGATIPSPAVGSGMILAPVDKLSLLKQVGEELEVVWRGGAAEPSAASPVMHGGRAYVIARGGILYGIDLATGEQAFRKRLKGSFWATPLVAGGKLFCINQDGDAYIVDAAGRGETLGTASFGDAIYGSPAAADGGMFVRSNAKLWKIAVVGQALVSPAATANRR
ncbi:MAG: PQQ-binding-like beta-propeller repeat protein [Planctomycetota bacterium]